MTDRQSTPILTACNIIRTQIDEIRERLSDEEPSEMEMSAICKAEMELSKLEGFAWRLLMRIAKSTSGSEEDENAVLRTDALIDSFRPHLLGP